MNKIRGLLKTAASPWTLATADLRATTAAPAVFNIDLRSDGRAIPAIVGLVVRVVGTVSLTVTSGLVEPAETPVVDVTGAELTSIEASGTFWIETDDLRYLDLSAETGALSSFSFFLIAS